MMDNFAQILRRLPTEDMHLHQESMQPPSRYPHVKDWWDTYSEQRAIEESAIFVVAPTWDSFRDAIKEQYYPVGSYEDFSSPHATCLDGLSISLCRLEVPFLYLPEPKKTYFSTYTCPIS
jgi:hypothetical protein